MTIENEFWNQFIDHDMWNSPTMQRLYQGEQPSQGLISESNTEASVQQENKDKQVQKVAKRKLEKLEAVEPPKKKATLQAPLQTPLKLCQIGMHCLNDNRILHSPEIIASKKYHLHIDVKNVPSEVQKVNFIFLEKVNGGLVKREHSRYLFQGDEAQNSPREGGKYRFAVSFRVQPKHPLVVDMTGEEPVKSFVSIGVKINNRGLWILKNIEVQDPLGPPHLMLPNLSSQISVVNSAPSSVPPKPLEPNNVEATPSRSTTSTSQDKTELVKKLITVKLKSAAKLQLLLQKSKGKPIDIQSVLEAGYKGEVPFASEFLELVPPEMQRIFQPYH